MTQLVRLLPATTGPGVRIHRNIDLAYWLMDGPVGEIARRVLGGSARPVRAIVFDKTAESNWTLGWHQDRTIAVRERFDVPGFEHWNSKAGTIHVEPPFDLIERMITARIHIDPVSPGNAPLLVATGSHRRGRIVEADIADLIDSSTTVACLAEAGDVWLYRTAILHASERSEGHASRRVLQVDFAAEDLPAGLEWAGLG